MATATTKGGNGGRPRAGFLGSLAHTPLAEVFRRIVSEELSGDLQVTVPEAIKTVYFDRGFIVFASSNLASDRLGESMIEAGRISRHEFALVSMLMKNTKRKFGEVLVEAGIVSDEELGRHVAAQVNRIVLSLFSEKRGMYSFDERSTEIPVGLMVSLSSYRILIEGVRRMSSKKLVLAGLPPLDTDVRLVDPPPFSLDVEKLRDVEKQTLRHVGDGTTLRILVENVGGNEGVALRACYGLLCGGVLKVETPDRGAAPLRVQEETGTFVLSEIRQKVAPKQAPPPVDTVPKPASPPEKVQPVEPARGGEVAFSATESDSSSFIEWLKGRWRGFWRFFANLFGEPERPSDVRRVTIATPEPDSPSPPSSPPEPVHAEPATVASPTEAAEPPTMGSVGVPSWSMKDDAEEEPEAFEVGAPSWSLKDDASSDEPEVTPDTLGVPYWSLKDDPNEPKTSRKKSKPRRESRHEGTSAPPWSVKDQSRPKPKSPKMAPLGPPTEILPQDVQEPLEAIDSELFIEADADDGGASLLSQIPAESIEIDEASLEVEIDLEEEALVELAEPERAETANEPPEAEPVSVEPAPVADVPPPSPVPSTSAPPAEDVVAPESESAGDSREQAMRRMKQSGGESRLLRDVKLHFRMRDWEGAVPLLQQLVEISPGKALYRGMLARAMSRHPALRKDAEEHFVEALRMSPQDPELHYWLGLYYKSFGLKSRAITEFRTTLRINPKHPGARKQMSGGKKDDALGSVMKKLFG